MNFSEPLFFNVIEVLRLCNPQMGRIQPLFFERAHFLAAMNKCLARSNKSLGKGKATKKREHPTDSFKERDDRNANGSDEQMFGAKEQVPHEGQCD